MMKRSLFALVLTVVCCAPVIADVLEGEIKKVNADDNVLTVLIKDKERDFKVPAEAKIYITEALGRREARNGLKDRDVRKGYRVRITTDNVRGEGAVKELIVLTGRRADG